MKYKKSKNDYSHLEGKELTWHGYEDDEVFTAIVIGCDYDVGITIVNKEDCEHRLTCLNGSVSPYGITDCIDYDALFYTIIEMIEKGEYSCNETHKIAFGEVIKTSPFIVCPFSA